MRRTAAFLAATLISLLAAKPVFSAPVIPGVGDRLSLSLTNKFGDVLANPAVAQILSDGLVLQRGTTAMKVKYEDLPPDISKKYQPMAAGLLKKEEKQGAANAAYFAYTGQIQAEQSQQLAAQQAEQNEQAADRADVPSSDSLKYLALVIPNQNWKLTILDLGFSKWAAENNTNQFVLRGLPGPNGFNLALFVDRPANDIPGNDPAYNFYWLNMGNTSLIDAESVKVQRRDNFIKVSYTAQNQLQANYFFAYQGRWVDLHLWKSPSEPGDEKWFAAFDNALAYGQ